MGRSRGGWRSVSGFPPVKPEALLIIDFMDEIYRGRYPAESGLMPLSTPTKDDANRAVSVAKRTLRTVRRLLTQGEPEPPGEVSDAETNGATERSETGFIRRRPGGVANPTRP